MTRPPLSLAILAMAAAALPPVTGKAETPPPVPMVRDGRFVMRDGEAIYAHVCAACHMADARGAVGAGAYPAIAGDPKLAAGGYAIRVVVRGQKGMPAFGPLLDDEQVAAVVTYVRTHFGNAHGGAVTAAEVKAAR